MPSASSLSNPCASVNARKLLSDVGARYRYWNTLEISNGFRAVYQNFSFSNVRIICTLTGTHVGVHNGNLFASY